MEPPAPSTPPPNSLPDSPSLSTPRVRSQPAPVTGNQGLTALLVADSRSGITSLRQSPATPGPRESRRVHSALHLRKSGTQGR